MILKNFIVFEGIDGAGTTTQLKMLKDAPETENFLYTAEPTPCPTGRFLREMLSGKLDISNETSAYIFAADRNEHVNGKFNVEDKTLITGIKQAVEKGYTVVSDRYMFSSLAYQSVQCNPEISERLNSFFPLPEYVFYFEIEPEKALERVLDRGEKTEIFEKIDFQKKVSVEYERVIKKYENSASETGIKIIRIDAEKTPEEIHKLILKNIF